MITIATTRKVTSERNLCDHIWVEEIFLTKLGAKIKSLFVLLDGERYSFNGIPDNIVREHRS